MFTNCRNFNGIVIFKRFYRIHAKLVSFLESEPSLRKVKKVIPNELLVLKKFNITDQLYLIDRRIAQSICNHILPNLHDKEQVLAEINPGPSLISHEILENSSQAIRLYEHDSEFAQAIKKIEDKFPGRVEVYNKSIYALGRISCQDKYDNTSRVTMMLKNVPKRDWIDEPVMTLIGGTPNLKFIHYLIRTMAMQVEIAQYGRVQLYSVMRPSDYLKLTAGPEQNMKVYQAISVIFQLLFDYTLLDKYPRNAFLPWEAKVIHKVKPTWNKSIDTDMLYLVRINQKPSLPIPVDQILPFFFFMKQLYHRGGNCVIPTAEKWIPGCGTRLILPSQDYPDYFDDISIYTQFHELNPKQVLSIFKEMILHEGFEQSPFTAMVQAELLKSETREGDTGLILEDTLEQQEYQEKVE